MKNHLQNLRNRIIGQWNINRRLVPHSASAGQSFTELGAHHVPSSRVKRWMRCPVCFQEGRSYRIQEWRQACSKNSPKLPERCRCEWSSRPSWRRRCRKDSWGVGRSLVGWLSHVDCVMRAVAAGLKEMEGTVVKREKWQNDWKWQVKTESEGHARFLAEEKDGCVANY